MSKKLQQLIERARERRLSGRVAPPEGDLRKWPVMRSVLVMVLEDHLAHLEASVPEQPTRWDGNSGRFVPDGPAPRAPDPFEDRTVRSLATLIGLGDERYGDASADARAA
jgi:hypothetical protein